VAAFGQGACSSDLEQYAARKLPIVSPFFTSSDSQHVASVVYMFSTLLILLAFTTSAAIAANASEWRSQSIYQFVPTWCKVATSAKYVSTRVMIDRYALPSDYNGSPCDVSKGTWCGGTWNSLTENLDYIQACNVLPG
jgi:hypothetical protein